ncbi:MAG: hypothetical protein JW384_02219 [Nitrosomonadaceae bacterium]|nr:hypothetical protein [Nitrosomonadaceae bacterium]
MHAQANAEKGTTTIREIANPLAQVAHGNFRHRGTEVTDAWNHKMCQIIKSRRFVHHKRIESAQVNRVCHRSQIAHADIKNTYHARPSTNHQTGFISRTEESCGGCHGSRELRDTTCRSPTASVHIRLRSPADTEAPLSWRQ